MATVQRECLEEGRDASVSLTRLEAGLLLEESDYCKRGIRVNNVDRGLTLSR